MLSRETCASTVSFRSCRSFTAHGGGRPSVATMELLETLAHAEERIMAAWTRIGLADIDKENKWAGFVEGRLRPFLFDYVRLQEAEEMAIAAENDRLFQEMFFASLRLKEPSRSKVLAQLVEAVTAQEVVSTSTEAEVDGHTTLPSFVSVVTALVSKSADNVSSAHEDGPCSHDNHNSRSPSVSQSEYIPLQDPAWAAVWHLARSMTHQELNRNLKSEVKRMNDIADSRLQQLCLLYKQRALLQLPPHQQTLLRRKYADKFLPEELHKARLPTSTSSVLASSASDKEYMTPGPSSGRATTCRSCHSVVKDELDLLSDSLPEGLCVNHECQQPCVTDAKSGSESATWVQDELEGRGTLFEVDLGDVTRFGRRQDLSLDRIAAETQDIYAEIIAQNTRMIAQANEELQCINELWELFEDGVDEGDSLDLKNKADCSKEDDERVQSRHEFMSRLKQMRQEYEQPDRTAEPSMVVGVDEMSSQRIGSNNNISNQNNGILFPKQTTHSSSLHGLSRSCTVMSDGGNSDDNVGGGGGSSSIGGTTSQLPAPLVKLFTIRSYAPILSYIVEVREDLQRRLLQRHVHTVQNITLQLTEMYRLYFEKTRDTAYSVVPDYMQWLREDAETVANKKFLHHASVGVDVNNSGEGNGGFWQQFLADFTPQNGNDTLRERIAEVQHVVARAKVELRVLRHRLHILSEVEPLLRSRSEIFEQQRAIQEGSRERLLSKKINMAKQLLFEENTRRQISRTLPKIYAQLEELLCQWNETMGNDKDHNSACRPLVLHGVDVADIVKQYNEYNARSQSRCSRSPPPSSQRVVGFVTPQKSPPPRAVNITSSAHVKLHMAKRSANPASSVSPVPVKRTAAVVTRQQRLHSMPLANEFLRRQPQALQVRSNPLNDKPKSTSPGVITPRKK